MNFKAQLYVDSENVFATHAEADQYAHVSLDGFQPFMSWRVVETNEPVTHRMTPFGEEAIGTASNFAALVHDQDQREGAQTMLTFATYHEADAYGQSLVGQKGIVLTSLGAKTISAKTWTVIPTSRPVTAKMTTTGPVLL